MSTNDEGEGPTLADEVEARHDALESLDTDEQIDQLKRINRDLAEEVQDLQDELAGTKKTMFSQINEIKSRLNGEDPTDPRSGGFYENLTTIEKYHRMPEDERDDLLSTARELAVVIFEHWTDWASTVDAGWLINTAHTRGKHGKSAIKADLESATGRDIHNTEVYRAMKQVAKLSARDPDDVEVVMDQYDREHITGGAFEFHERMNADNSRKYKILKLVDEEAVMLP